MCEKTVKINLNGNYLLFFKDNTHVILNTNSFEIENWKHSNIRNSLES